MAYTEYAEFLRVLRIKNHENMGDTAKFLGVNVAFVSAVESGKKNVPEEWIGKIVAHYNLNDCEKNNLISAINNSKTTSKINLVDVPNFKRQVALQFQRSFDDMDDETAKKIIDLLKES